MNHFILAGQVEICNYLGENSVRNYYLFLIVMITQLVECLLEAQEVGSSSLSHHTRSIYYVSYCEVLVMIN